MKKLLTLLLCFALVISGFSLFTGTANYALAEDKETEAVEEKNTEDNDKEDVNESSKDDQKSDEEDSKKDSDSNDDQATEEGYTISDIALVKYKGSYYFEGIFENTSKEEYYNVSIKYDVIDKDDNYVNQSYVNLYKVQPGEKFKFRDSAYGAKKDYAVDKSSIEVTIHQAYSDYENAENTLKIENIESKKKSSYLNVNALIKNVSDKTIANGIVWITLKDNAGNTVAKEAVHTDFLKPNQTYKSYSLIQIYDKDYSLDKDSVILEYEELDEDKLLNPALFEISKLKKSKDKISGVMKNNSGEDYSYLNLYFDLIDKEGNKIGQSSSSVSDFEDGKSWKFEDYIYSYQKNSTVDTEHPYIKGF